LKKETAITLESVSELERRQKDIEAEHNICEESLGMSEACLHNAQDTISAVRKGSTILILRSPAGRHRKSLTIVKSRTCSQR